MKLLIKNLKQVEYSIEVSGDNLTILEVKKEIERVHSFDASTLKLLFNGQILSDAKTLADYKIQNESVIIMMSQKVKIQPKKEEPVPVPAPQENTNPIANPVPNVNPVPQPQPQQNVQQNPPQAPPKPKADYSAQIASLMEMGYEKDKAEEAITAAKGNIELAIEFIYNGIPENMPNLDDNYNPQAGGNAQIPDNISRLQETASIIKVICQNTPDPTTTLRSLLTNLEQTHRDLFDYLKQNEEEFRNLISQPVTEQDNLIFQRYMRENNLDQMNPQQGQQQPQRRGQIPITISKEDDEAIKRLMELGNFDKMEVAQTYFACDKNEDIAANMLFEQKWSEEAQGGYQFRVEQPKPNPQPVPQQQQQPQVIPENKPNENKPQEQANENKPQEQPPQEPPKEQPQQPQQPPQEPPQQPPENKPPENNNQGN